MAEPRKLFGRNFTREERIMVASLAQQPGWELLVRMMAEACRTATESVIKLDPTTERYPEVLMGLQTMARAMNKFSADVLESVRTIQVDVHKQLKAEDKPEEKEGVVSKRFSGFKMPVPVEPKSPTEGQQ
jgi:TRAP-type mannitol/chloroaromatic compound transport system substrate-binding protein